LSYQQAMATAKHSQVYRDTQRNNRQDRVAGGPRSAKRNPVGTSRPIVPFLVLTAGVEIVIALAWQPQQQRSVDLVIAASAHLGAGVDTGISGLAGALSRRAL
jgi:hypothetical protein